MPRRLLLTQRGCQATRKRPLGCSRIGFHPRLFVDAKTIAVSDISSSPSHALLLDMPSHLGV